MKHPILTLLTLALCLGLCLCAAAEEADVVETGGVVRGRRGRRV